MPKFSVIMPVYSELEPRLEGNSGHLHFRGKMVQRAIKSIINQQFPDWELILVNDGCVDEQTPQIMQKFANSDKRIRIVKQVNQNRAVARNRGMDEAKGEWLCWLDCDDEYSSHYLRELDIATKDFPDYKIFNFGSLVYWPDHHSTVRSVFAPAIEGKGHVWFRAGHIGTGSFIFRRDLWEEKRINKGERDWLKIGEEYHPYRIPDKYIPIGGEEEEPVLNAYTFAAASHFPLRYKREEDEYRYDNTENPDEAMQDGVYRHGTSLGNPWGDDFFQFYLLTRDNHSKSLDILLYIQYPRAHEEVYEHFGEIYEA